jgi:hypothetical protein
VVVVVVVAVWAGQGIIVVVQAWPRKTPLPTCAIKHGRMADLRIEGAAIIRAFIHFLWLFHFSFLNCDPLLAPLLTRLSFLHMQLALCVAHCMDKMP